VKWTTWIQAAARYQFLSSPSLTEWVHFCQTVYVRRSSDGPYFSDDSTLMNEGIILILSIYSRFHFTITSQVNHANLKINIFFSIRFQILSPPLLIFNLSVSITYSESSRIESISIIRMSLRAFPNKWYLPLNITSKFFLTKNSFGRESARTPLEKRLLHSVRMNGWSVSRMQQFGLISGDNAAFRTWKGVSRGLREKTIGEEGSISDRFLFLRIVGSAAILPFWKALQP